MSRVLLEKLPVTETVKNPPHELYLYGTRSFITVFQELATCPYREPAKSIPRPPNPF